ncbi:molybdopterin-guanine dinucleotide biosynthesis protein B [Methylacidiphilum sp. Yel]|jgi:molybdopterin-guanine dinucleotide biosynthesis protein B|uniref:molybdopterin-guanine dinucleotide biosynthesis protein B n=1 Tax=Methylacidiphilum sp. Yel TaxID=1847730 RepID=UPI00106BA14F|nr:molybdopterin-guanine dinucleotide biosynthesis protein B [Methylacidiphilum sp. Yel]TFE66930.1 molybdopterin-guanine dinucleotide biosynthesis protein B [Methylacidiphilum sp. Yel]
MQKQAIAIVGFIGRSGCGKTTLICKLIALLTSKGYKVGALKHTHKGFQMDCPGKDSFKFKESGASSVCIISEKQAAMIVDCECSQQMVLNAFFDLMRSFSYHFILIEGFKKDPFPKFCFIDRIEQGEEVLQETDNCLGFITGQRAPVSSYKNLPVFFRDDATAISSFLLDTRLPLGS